MGGRNTEVQYLYWIVWFFFLQGRGMLKAGRSAECMPLKGLINVRVLCEGAVWLCEGAV